MKETTFNREYRPQEKMHVKYFDANSHITTGLLLDDVKTSTFKVKFVYVDNWSNRIPLDNVIDLIPTGINWTNTGENKRARTLTYINILPTR